MGIKQLPFTARPDLSPYLIHLTRKTEKKSGFLVLQQIIFRDKMLKGSDKTGFIKGSTPAVCFMDIPFFSLKYLFTYNNARRYEPYGIFVKKETAYLNGARPVYYMSQEEENEFFGSRAADKWRIVKLDVDDTNAKEPDWICWTQEREWRCPIQYKLDSGDYEYGILVKSIKQAEILSEKIYAADYKGPRPIAILPLDVICQGLSSFEKPLNSVQASSKTIAIDSTLHEAMKLVLTEKNNCGLTAEELAEEINRRGLYLRQDKEPLESWQISARWNKYKELFYKHNGKIYLQE